MRVSTAQFYFQNSLQLTNKQSNVNEQIEHLSTGQRVLTAKDDAVAFGTLTGYKDELNLIEKYQRNITQAENRNSLLDTSFNSATDILQQFKTMLIQANNGAMSTLDLQSLGDIGENLFEEMLNIANQRDETGGYIFSGYQIDAKPFTLQPDDSVTYEGDNGLRELQIAKNVIIPTNISGLDAFQSVPNAIGDFTPVYNTNTSGLSVKKATVNDPSVYNTSTIPPDFNFDFTSATDLTVRDGGGNTIFSTTSYSAGQLISLPNGVDVQINGNPLPGDNFDLTPQENISVFETMKDALAWVNTGDSPADVTQHSVDYAKLLGQVDTALNHITHMRSKAGVRMQLIENQKNNHLDSELYLTTGRSKIEDLDFAKAISNFEQSKIALQAAQQTFTQVKNLSLFNYL